MNLSLAFIVYVLSKNLNIHSRNEKAANVHPLFYRLLRLHLQKTKFLLILRQSGYILFGFEVAIFT